MTQSAPNLDAKRTPLIILAGRPNAGKSSLYNLLTDGGARVGNFPGITVDVLQGVARLPASAGAVSVVDLPGFYAFSATENAHTDEGIAQTFLTDLQHTQQRSLLIHVIDATQLELSLALLQQFIRRHDHVVALLTQEDLLREHDVAVDAQAFSAATGVQCLALSAHSPAAATQLKSFIADQLSQSPPTVKVTFDPHAVASQCLTSQRRPDTTGGQVPAREKAPRLTPRSRTEKTDRWLLHPVVGPFVFLTLLALVFAAVFLVADPAAAVIEKCTRWMGLRVVAALGTGKLSSFFVDGLLGGAGTVLAFLPQIVILTVALEALDGSGYLARGVFLLDRFLRSVGLGGRSLVPLLMGHACAVAAIPATRILRDPKERLLTIMVLPLMTCSARIPTYSLLISTFFSSLGPLKQAAIFVGLYMAGILSACLSAAVLRRTTIKGRSLPLVIELPLYRTPQRKVLLAAALRGGRQFVGDVGKTIVLASAILWLVLNIQAPWITPSSTAGVHASRTEQVRQSVGAQLGRALEPVSKYAGFDWRINVGLIGSFGARELMVGTMGVIMGLENVGDDTSSLRSRLREARTPTGARAYGPANAAALLVFFVLACQCMSTVAAVKRETRSWKWAAILLAYTYTLAFTAAVLVFQIGRWI